MMVLLVQKATKVVQDVQVMLGQEDQQDCQGNKVKKVKEVQLAHQVRKNCITIMLLDFFKGRGYSSG